MRKLKNSELNRITLEEFKQLPKTPFVVVLDNVRSLNNIGSVFRTSDAFRLTAIYLCGVSATPPNNEIHKTALDSEYSMEWKYFDDTKSAISELRENNYVIVAIEQAEESTMLDSFEIDAQQKYAIIFGHEVKGVSQEVVDMSDFCIELPQLGVKHSFNISVSVGIVLWEFFNQYKKKKYNKKY